jgi:hypothetical protein
MKKAIRPMKVAVGQMVQYRKKKFICFVVQGLVIASLKSSLRMPAPVPKLALFTSYTLMLLW